MIDSASITAGNPNGVLEGELNARSEIEGDVSTGMYVGPPGKTPEKGVDYWTPEDKQEIVDEVLENIPESGVTSWNDLEDKPFGEISETIFEWDMDTSNKEIIEGDSDIESGVYLYKLSDEPLIIEDISNLKLIGSNGTVIDVSPDMIYESDTGFEIAYEDDNFVAVLTVMKISQYGLGAGVYLLVIEGMEMLAKIVREKIATIDPKFLPEQSGGVTSWNDLTDKPFYETPVREVYFAEQAFSSVAITMGMTKFNAPAPTPGETYYIVVDGEEYECTCTSTVYMSRATYKLEPVGGHGVGIDFLEVTYGSNVGQGRIYGLSAGDHTIAIHMGYDEIKTLDEKYIPDTIARKTDIPEIPETQEVPTKLSELENDTGFITANDIPEGGVTSWNDLEDKPFDEVPAFDIQWNGDMTDKFALDMSMLGYGNGVYFVKVDNTVFTIQNIVGAAVRFSNTGGFTVIESDIDTQAFPGAYNIKKYVVIVHNQSSLNKALGLPDGYVTNGTYFLIDTRLFINRFTSANKIVLLDEKHIPDTIARKTDIPEGGCPMFDLSAMGMTAHDVGGGRTEFVCDTTEILAAMRRGVVGFVIPTNYGPARVIGSTLEIMSIGTPQLVSSFVLDGQFGDVCISADDTSIWVESSIR